MQGERIGDRIFILMRRTFVMAKLDLTMMESYVNQSFIVNIILHPIPLTNCPVGLAFWPRLGYS